MSESTLTKEDILLSVGEKCFPNFIKHSTDKENIIMFNIILEAMDLWAIEYQKQNRVKLLDPGCQCHGDQHNYIFNTKCIIHGEPEIPRRE